MLKFQKAFKLFNKKKYWRSDRDDAPHMNSLYNN